MNLPEINWNLCQSCDPCEVIPICKLRAIVKLDPDEPPYIEQSRCNNCRICIPECTFGAIVISSFQTVSK